MKRNLLLAGLLLLGSISCENSTTSPYVPDGIYYGPASLTLSGDTQSISLNPAETHIENMGGDEYRFVVIIPGYLNDTIQNIALIEGLGFHHSTMTDTILGNFNSSEEKIVLIYDKQDSIFVVKGVRY
jgi:hypothetical protein